MESNTGSSSSSSPVSSSPRNRVTLRQASSPLAADETELKAAVPLEACGADGASASTRRTYGQRRVTDEHKRERNRLTFRRFYQRKQDTLRELRGEERQLTAQYELLKLSRHEITESSTPNQPGSSILELISHKDELAAEQAQLRRVAEQQLKTRILLGRLLDKIQDETEQELTVQPTTGHRLALPAPVHDPEALLHDALRRLREIQLLYESSQVKAGDGLDAVGWQCWSQVQENNGRIAFRVTKYFPEMTLPLGEAALRTWHFYSDNKSSGSNVYLSQNLIAPSSQLRMLRQVLSAPSDTTRLVYRRLTRVHDAIVSGGSGRKPPIQVTKSIYSVTRRVLDTPGGFCVVSHSVPNEEAYDRVGRGLHGASSSSEDDSDLNLMVSATPREVQEEWIRELTWWRIEPTATGGVHVSYSGLAHVCMALSPSACFMEFLRLAVQWEDAVLGAKPLLCLNQD